MFKRIHWKRLKSPEKGFYKIIKMSGIEITIEKKEKPNEISILKEGRLALGLFVANYAVKKEAFSYPLTTYPLALSTAEGTLYKSCTKYSIMHEMHHARNIIYDAMAVIRSVPSQPTWENFFKILMKLYKLKESTKTIFVVTITRTKWNTLLKE